MKLIKPAEISAKIMTLIDEAKEKIIIVSPYNNLIGWTKLTNRIKKAQRNGIKISWFTRKNNVSANNSDEVRSLNIEPILVDDLHAKVYFNEKYAIFTSMNMSKASDDKSIDLGYITETLTEYEELYNIFETHILNFAVKPKHENYTKVPTNVTKELKTDELYIQLIHEHIQKTYGTFDYKYHRENLLEYYDFLNSRCTLQFIPYSQAIKIIILFPKPMTKGEIKSLFDHKKINFKAKQLIELELCQEKEDNFIKYYFEKPFKKVQSWNPSLIKEFLHDLDILINNYVKLSGS